MTEFLVIAGKVLFLLLGGAVLALHWIGLPANWILLVLAFLYALVVRFDPVGWGTLGILAGFAVVAELLEMYVGIAYTSRQGASRWGVGGAFGGGIVGGVVAAPWVPPLGALLGAFAGAFAGAVLLEYAAQRRMGEALRSGRAAFLGKVFAAVVKTACGFWMWILLAFRLFAG